MERQAAQVTLTDRIFPVEGQAAGDHLMQLVAATQEMEAMAAILAAVAGEPGRLQEREQLAREARAEMAWYSWRLG
jgi:hypothetical protein